MDGHGPLTAIAARIAGSASQPPPGPRPPRPRGRDPTKFGPAGARIPVVAAFRHQSNRERHDSAITIKIQYQDVAKSSLDAAPGEIGPERLQLSSEMLDSNDTSPLLALQDRAQMIEKEISDIQQEYWRYVDLTSIGCGLTRKFAGIE